MVRSLYVNHQVFCFSTASPSNNRGVTVFNVKGHLLKAGLGGIGNTVAEIQPGFLFCQCSKQRTGSKWLK
jgi:hypothetical protein